MKESDIQRSIMTYLDAQNIKYWRMPVQPIKHGSRYKKNPLKGFPDIAGILPGGRFFVIEVKTATGKTTPEQKEWMLQLSQAGAATLLARSIEDVIIFFRSLNEN